MKFDQLVNPDDLGTSKIVKVKQAGARNWAAASRTAGAKGDQ